MPRHDAIVRKLRTIFKRIHDRAERSVADMVSGLRAETRAASRARTLCRRGALEGCGEEAYNEPMSSDDERLRPPAGDFTALRGEPRCLQSITNLSVTW
jgi:hypothetical protein